MKFSTKRKGKPQQFNTGAQRDTQSGKPRYSLIPVKPLKRVAELYARGADLYGSRNWELGMPASRLIDSLLRHAFQWELGEMDEDHLAAVIWNAFALMFFEEERPDLDDVHKKKRRRKKK